MIQVLIETKPYDRSKKPIPKRKLDEKTLEKLKQMIYEYLQHKIP